MPTFLAICPWCNTSQAIHYGPQVPIPTPDWFTDDDTLRIAKVMAEVQLRGCLKCGECFYKIKGEWQKGVTIRRVNDRGESKG